VLVTIECPHGAQSYGATRTVTIHLYPATEYNPILPPKRTVLDKLAQAGSSQISRGRAAKTWQSSASAVILSESRV